jgi:threonyl-tRNA synthetase
MVHRAIFGSIERFFGVLIENTAGDFPLWLAPTHLRILPVVDDVLDYCKLIKKKAEALGIRAEIDTSGERLPKMIRNSEKEKIPVTVIIGAKEKESNDIAIRLRKVGEVKSLQLDVLLTTLKDGIDKNLELNQISNFVVKPIVPKEPVTAAAVEGVSE